MFRRKRAPSDDEQRVRELKLVLIENLLATPEVRLVP
jgi:hypothetical protein